MLNSIKKIFASPTFEDEEKNRAAQYLNAILYAGILLDSVVILTGESLLPTTNIVLSSLLLLMIILQILMRAGKVQLSIAILLSSTWVAMTYMAWKADGVRNASLIVYILLIFLASLLSNPRIFIFFTVSSIFSIWGLAYAEKNSIITPSLDTISNLARDLSVIFILIAIVIYLTIKNLNKALSLAKENEAEALLRNKELLQLQNALEERIKMRTSELEIKASQLQAIAEISKGIALIQNLKILLPQIASLVSERFDFYHVGIFLLSKDGNFAQLQAANSPGGKRMLARQHQLEVGRSGIVGRVAKDGQARVALDVGQDAAYFDNPDLPDTRSEMALPLKIGSEIIGVLDVQSTREAIFSEDDLEIFRTLANQVSIAIENARQADITQAALKEARAISRQYTKQAWQQVAITEQRLGYSYFNENLHPIAQEEASSEQEENIHTIPVKVHGEIIGHLKIQQGNTVLNAEDKILIASVANRAALALENARLLDDSQRRAARESTIGNISTKIGASIQMNTIIQTTVQELGNALGDSEVVFRLANSPEDIQAKTKEKN